MGQTGIDIGLTVDGARNFFSDNGWQKTKRELVAGNYKDAILQDGKAEIKTANLSHKIAKLIPDINDLTDKISNSEEVEITFDIVPDQNSMGIKNIVVSSDSIEGKGEMILGKDSTHQSDIRISFSKIDLVSWKKAKPKEGSDESADDSAESW